MRRRLFWTIFGVAAATGLVVLVGATVASQRAAVDATYRELANSSNEVVSLIEDAVETMEQRPGAVLDLFRLLEGDRVGPFLTRLTRAAGGSEVGIGIVVGDDEVRSSATLFDRVPVDTERLLQGLSQRTSSGTGDLVVITPTSVPIRGGEQAVLLVGLARAAPIVRLSDQIPGLVVIVGGIGLLSALLARLLSTQMVRRLEPLAAASHRLAEGDMSARVPDLEDPELDEVAAAFNEMAGELEASQEREREFILGVGHDLRTPLTTIRGYAEALELGRVPENEIERVGSVLGVQSRQLARLIEDLSTLARLEGTEFSLRSERVDVGAHIAEMVEGFRARADELGVGLVVEAAEGVEIVTDPDRLGQIAQNLVENALRYTPETGSVTVAVRELDNGALIEVSDTGTGIATEEIPHIFDRHYVGSHRTVRREGSGLGLSIVKGLVERMGGEVRARSELGRGTTISVRLPGGA